jgi:hypothetical protein
LALVAMSAALVALRPAAAQTFPTDDPVIRRIWQLGMPESQAYRLAQVLMDSIGPRLTGTPQIKAGNDWAVKMYTSWGIPARNEQYGTWLGWSRGPTEIVLLTPRVRSLEGTMLAWSAGTDGRPVEGPFVVLPQFSSRAEFEAWLPQASGKFVGLDLAQPTCRPDRQWEEFALPQSFERMTAERNAARGQWTAWRGTGQSGISAAQLRKRIEDAGALGVVHSNWSNDYGVNKIFGTSLRRIPTLDLSCEDYGLIFRMARNNQNPRLRVTAQSEYLGEIPVFNTIAEMKGTQLPNEYVMLSAHFDSWDGSSGSTDNGTGTIVMMEAMRILKLAYPNPKRTILVGHWSGEEQGLNGSRAFAKDHPEIVTGLQSLFNQDNGTGRVQNIGMAGLTGAGPIFQTWVPKIPTEIAGQINLGIPGSPSGGGSDNASFICSGAPAFGLGALNWGYSTYTWHTNRDTFDKVVFDDLKNNATLTAMLVYLASEEPQRMPRDRREMPSGRGGQPQQWPECRDGARSSTEYFSR